MKYKGIEIKEFESENPVLFDTPTNCMGSSMSKTDEFYRLAALRAAEGFTAKKPVMTRYQRYYASHKEQEREWYRKWKKEHPEKIKEIQMRYIRKNLDKWKAYLREWRRKKKETAKLQGVA